jgi:hypothetical protein
MKDKIVSFFKGVWTSVAANSRDIISTLFWITAVLFVTQLIASVGNACSVDLHDIKNFVFAIGKFAAATLVGVGYISHITFRDSLGQHDQNEFMETWKNVLTPKERLEWFFKVTLVGLVAAVICFSVGV